MTNLKTNKDKIKFAGKLWVKIAFCLALTVPCFSPSPARAQLGWSKSELSGLAGQIITLTNTDRAANGENVLQEDQRLDLAARLKAEDMATQGYFSHTNPQGLKFTDWLDMSGYNFRTAGENLAMNFFNARNVETAWMDSPHHKYNILNSAFQKIGVAVAQGSHDGYETLYYAVFFASPLSTSPKAPQNGYSY